MTIEALEIRYRLTRQVVSRQFDSGERRQAFTSMAALLASAQGTRCLPEETRRIFDELARFAMTVGATDIVRSEAGVAVAALSALRSSPLATGLAAARLTEALSAAHIVAGTTEPGLSLLAEAAEQYRDVQGVTGRDRLRCLRHVVATRQGDVLQQDVVFRRLFGGGSGDVSAIAESCDDGAVLCAYYTANALSRDQRRFARDAARACAPRITRLGEAALSSPTVDVVIAHLYAVVLMASSLCSYAEATDPSAAPSSLDKALEAVRIISETSHNSTYLDNMTRSINALRQRSVAHLIWDEVREKFLGYS